MTGSTHQTPEEIRFNCDGETLQVNHAQSPEKLHRSTLGALHQHKHIEHDVYVDFSHANEVKAFDTTGTKHSGVTSPLLPCWVPPEAVQAKGVG